jgi:pimeloyl-ACP methyl ester carboxylesterase
VLAGFAPGTPGRFLAVSDTTVLCLHGLGRSGSDWNGVRAGLAGLGPVLAPDLPRASLAELSERVAALPPAQIVVGHSLGGVLALRRAASSPAVRALVLSDSFLPIVAGGRTRRATALGYASHRIALARELAARGARPRPRRSTARALHSLLRVGFGAEAFHATARAVACPVLILHGRDDHHVPVDFAIAAAARHPQWTLRILAGAGHDAHLAAPDRWLGIVLPWLEGAKAGPR